MLVAKNHINDDFFVYELHGHITMAKNQGSLEPWKFLLKWSLQLHCFHKTLATYNWNFFLKVKSFQTWEWLCDRENKFDCSNGFQRNVPPLRKKCIFPILTMGPTLSNMSIISCSFYRRSNIFGWKKRKSRTSEERKRTKERNADTGRNKIETKT